MEGIPPFALSKTPPNRPLRLPPASSALFVIFLNPSVKLDFKLPLISKKLVLAPVLATENFVFSESTEGIPPFALSKTPPNRPLRLPPASSALFVIFLNPSVKLDFKLPLISKNLLVDSVLAAENLVLTESKDGSPIFTFSFNPPSELPSDDSIPPPIADFNAPPTKSLESPLTVDTPGIDFNLSLIPDLRPPLTSKNGEDCSSVTACDFLTTVKSKD